MFSSRAFLILGIFILSSSCIGTNVDNGAFYGDGAEVSKGENLASNHREEILNLLDTKRYFEIIRYFELHPEIALNPSYRVYLGQAYIGAGGFELGVIATQVTGVQSTVADRWNTFSKGCPTDSLRRSDDKTSTECLIVRVLRAAPDPDNAYLLRGEEIFTEIFKNGSDVPAEYRVYLSAIHLISTFRRAAELVLNFEKIETLDERSAIRTVLSIREIEKDARKTWGYLGSSGQALARKIWNSAIRSDEAIQKLLILKEILEGYPTIQSALDLIESGRSVDINLSRLEDEVTSAVREIRSHLSK